MREFVFALDYEPDSNPVADVLAAHPETTVRSLSCHVTPESLWRVDHATGPPDALAALEDAFLTADYCSDCLVTEDCGADCDSQVLDRADGTLVLYTYWARTPVCTSVPHLALEHLGEGLLFETRREGRRYRWRIVLSDAANVPGFFAALGDEVGECAGMEMIRLTDLSPRRARADADEELLPREQRDALRAAVEHGYYETPRDVDLSELAADLGVPRSTLSYRLRRAEAQLATQFVAGDDRLDSLSPTV
ncbi:helix-turn-helix domain-containing protein [Halegenticoccus tardaugens]|uniref:helix-turn-helix domain-containing protein n=1 Tax=Halegenticoccus tardaugens TaxID=2071624 RepID=UPI00100AB00C|nr:helix-turn-helix domain-containing protein [Halegenticoccus tardaugens]